METTESLARWIVRDNSLAWGSRTYVMGILNVTPDSFSDGGDFWGLDQACNQVALMIDHGVDIVDVGGQSSRPNAEEVSPEEESERVIPVIKAIRAAHPQLPISIDTTRAQVADVAMAAGADIVNDISAGIEDPLIFEVAARWKAPIILMHRRGTAKTMQQMTDYDDLWAEMMAYFERQIALAMEAGIPRHHISVDPGIGFAKTAPQNIQILQELDTLKSLDCPILVGTSRKSFIGHILSQPDPKQRVWGTAASCVAAIASGADILRVHDVAEMIQVSQVADAIYR